MVIIYAEYVFQWMEKEKDILHTHVFYNVTQHFPVLLKCFAGECDPLIKKLAHSQIPTLGVFYLYEWFSC